MYASKSKRTPSYNSTSSSTTMHQHMKIYGWTLTYLKPYKWQVFLLIVYAVMITMGEMAFPKFIAYVIDYAAPQKKVDLFRNALLILLGVMLVMFISKALQNQLMRSVREKASRDLQFGMFEHLRKLGFAYYEQHPVGETLSLLNTNVAAVQTIYTRFLPNLIQLSLTLIVPLVLVISMNWKLTLLIMPCYLLYYLGGPYIDKQSTLYLELQTTTREVLNKKTYDTVSAIAEVRAFGAEAWEMERFLEKFQIWKRTRVTSLLYRHLRTSLRWVSISVGILLLYIYGAKLVRSGALQVGEFTAFSVYCTIVMNSITRISVTIMEQSYVLKQAKLLYDFIKTEPAIQQVKNPVHVEKLLGELQFHNVHFHYTTRSNVLNGFTAQVKPGQKVALVGTSGGGKSTLIKLIGRFYDPTEGEISLDGVALKELSLQQLRESVGYVFQETYLFGTTIRENIRFGRPEASDEEIEMAAKAAFAHEFILQMKDGYETQVGERGIKLSGGQKQRIAIARLFIKNPAIIVLDEATASLDNSSEQAVQDALNALLAGRTTLTVAHRLTTIQHYDVIIVLDEGRVAEIGTYEELISQKGLLYQLAEGEYSRA